MRFDYSSKPTHPRKLYKFINNFVKENISIEYPIEHCHTFNLPPSFPLENLWDKLENGEIEKIPVFADITIHKGKKNCAYTEKEQVYICFSELMDFGTKAVRENAISRCKTLKGFSTFIFTLLHEVGHIATQYEDFADKEYTDKEKKEITLECFETSNNWMEFERKFQSYHYMQPSEIAATDWAIEFVKNPNNRKILKNFEREFFKLWNTK
jgi:hypothetical protein